MRNREAAGGQPGHASAVAKDEGTQSVDGQPVSRSGAKPIHRARTVLLHNSFGKLKVKTTQ